MRRKTNRMLAIEEAYGGQDIEDILIPLVTEKGLRVAAARLGISIATTDLWTKQLGYEMRLVRVNGRSVPGQAANHAEIP